MQEILNYDCGWSSYNREDVRTIGLGKIVRDDDAETILVILI